MTTAPFTPEQKKWIEESRRKAVAHAVRRYAVSATIGFLVLLASNIYVWRTGQSDNAASRQAIVDSGQVVSIAGCNRDWNTIKALRTIILNSQKEVNKLAKTGDLPQSQIDATRRITKNELDLLKYPDCQAAGTILTSDTDAVPPAPAPLTPPHHG